MGVEHPVNAIPQTFSSCLLAHMLSLATIIEGTSFRLSILTAALTGAATDRAALACARILELPPAAVLSCLANIFWGVLVTEEADLARMRFCWE
jgi:hypothetical protein